MLIFAVDTSSTSGSLSLLRDETVLINRVISSDEPYSASLLREASKLLDSQLISFEEIDLFAVNAGPGSFTGLRVGLTSVKAWAEVWGRPVAAVSGLEATAAQIGRRAAPGSFIAAVTDARRGQIFGALFRVPENGSGLLERMGDEVLATADEFLESLRPQVESADSLAIACLQAEVVQPAMQRLGFSCSRIEVESDVLAPFIGQLGYARALRGDVIDALHLDANYIRRSDAEMNWKSG
jgi:tRNA threonylcarbamoyladenosine biosynthesis protein TsaB